MPPNVLAGATTTCTMGGAPGTLNVLPRPVMIENRPAANIGDFAPIVNIVPFGTCRSLLNPMTAAATAAAAGILTPAGCIPATVAPWVPGSPTALVAGMPALTLGSTCVCAYGGVISVTQPGAMTTVTG